MTFTADGAPWIWARLDWVIAQVKLDPAWVVEVLVWCQGVHHLSLASASLGLDEDRRQALFKWLRGLLNAGKSRVVLDELEALPAARPKKETIWGEIGYLTRHF